MSDENEEIEGDCPSCGAEVSYEEWGESSTEGAICCPACGVSCDVEDVFPSS